MASEVKLIGEFRQSVLRLYERAHHTQTCLLQSNIGWQIERGIGHKINTKKCMFSNCSNMLLLC
jgi:hypothetical protein